MIFWNHVPVTFTERRFFSTLFFCACHFINSNKISVRHRLIDFRYFSKLEVTTGIRFHDPVSLLHCLGDVNELKHGKSLHSLYIKSGFNEDAFVQNNLIRFYGSFGDLGSAWLLFDEMGEPNLVSWTSIISAYVHDGQDERGLQLFALMFRSGLRANEFGFSVALKACRILQDFLMGMLIHAQIVKCGFESCSFCSASVLSIYCEYGDIGVALKFFDGIPLSGRSEASWNTLLNSYVQISAVEEGVDLFCQMMYYNVSPNCFTYSVLTKLCPFAPNLDLARFFHGHLIKFGFENDVVVGGALLDAYSKLGLIDDACKVFQNLKEKDNLVWCTLLAGFHQIGNADQGLKFYLKFLSEGHKPDPFTYATVFSLCSNLEAGNVGSQVHCTFIKDGFIVDSFLGSTLIDMYGGLEMVFDSYKCFLEVGRKNEICFSSMINVLLLHSHEEKALELFSGMMNLGFAPSHSTTNYALRACTNLGMLKEGRFLHAYIVKNFNASYSNIFCGNALIEMYAKFGEVHEARKVFRGMEMQNEFSWTTMISVCNELGLFDEALRLFQDMFLSPKLAKPSEFTIIIIIQMCTKLTALEKGKQIHSYIIKMGFEYNPFVESALINMYAAFKHEIQNAFRVFSSVKEPDLVSCSTMVTAWAQNGYEEEALKLFAEFRNATNFLADDSILCSCLSACAGLAALEVGAWLHAYVVRTGFASHFHVTSSIIDMYSKCGTIQSARKFFDEIGNRNLVCWTAMVSGYAHNGLGKEAVEVFKEMKEAGWKPDSVTFIGVLTACSHAGLVNEGRQFFESMANDYGLAVSINHYACMVDLLGRADQVEEAETFIKKAPVDPKSKSLLWKTLLGACNKYGNIEMGRRFAEMVVGLEPNDPSTYVLLSNIYASAASWDNSMETRKKMKEDHVNKKPGYSRIQLGS